MSQPRPDFHSLSVAERMQLAEVVWDSIAAENPDSVVLSPEQRREIRARTLAHDQDPPTALPCDQVRPELFQKNH